MPFKTLFKRPFDWVILIFIILFVAVFIFTFFNASFYDTPIAQITKIENKSTSHITDDNHNKETKYNQTLTRELLTGKFQRQTTKIPHHHLASQADSEAPSKQTKGLLHLGTRLDDAYITEKKRDSRVVMITGIFLLTV